MFCNLLVNLSLVRCGYLLSIEEQFQNLVPLMLPNPSLFPSKYISAQPFWSDMILPLK